MLRKSIPIILALFSVACLYGQNPKKAKKLYKKAYEYYGYGDYDKSVEWANKSLEKDSLFINTLILFSDIYNLKGNYEAELAIYRRIIRIDSTDLRSHVNMADLYMKNGEFEKAFAKYAFLKQAGWLPDRYNGLISKNHKESTKALELINNPKEFNREKLDGEINSDLDEYWPYITPDGKKLFFTRTSVVRQKEGNLRREENIHITKWQDSLWVNEAKLPSIINTNENEGAQCITQDGKTMFFTVCKTTPGTRGDCNIYITRLKGKKWTIPEKLPTPVNTTYKETQPSISYDGRMLFFSSDRPGGKGGMDIWVTRMNDDSLWANPKNLSEINSNQNEESPFIHPDNKTIYFSSTGHYGLGKGDFFMAKLGKDSVVNLGYPLNNHEMQLGIYVDLEGIFGYYASVNIEENTGLDVYRFTLPNDVKPEPLKIIKGFLVDAISNEPIKNGDIVVYNLAKNQHVVNYTTLKDGSFKFGLPANTQFAILAEAEGYLPHSVHSKAEKLGTDSTLIIKLNPIVKEETFALQNIFFEFDSASLKPISTSEINYLASFLKKYPKVIIEIGGHTDNVGAKSYNQKLSEERANAVYKAVEKIFGSDISKRVKVKGYGDSKPIADNSTEEGRQLNRRTEIKILSSN
ncbi:MAG: PD40 domain-containing protein [Bacteroidia bacterium]